MMNRILYTSKSRFGSFFYFFWMFFGIIVILFLSLYFSRNPVLISLLLLCPVTIVLGNSRDSIIVMEDQFQISMKRMLPILSKSAVFYFSEIEKIEADLPMTQKSSIMAALRTWSSSSPIPVQMSDSNKVTIIYKDGRVKKLSPRIYRND